ncbi:unnamed protein product [Callosobruchus maculatus]|uniref:KASH domain-containing protein n=1 Tax=Callosobruchus maculatus TaxID=64391 RepID=A0A653CQ31_CALMS|nr:unnamed protein product [Callosobruchus maculatus]
MIEKWGNSLQNDTGSLPPIKECQPSVMGLHDLYSNITSFITVLQALTSKILSESSDRSLGCQKLQALSTDSKNVKKFTLRPARFTVRSVSPDSSSLETGTASAAILPLFNNSNSIHETSIQEECTVVNRISLSPDSQASKSRSPASRDGSICENRSFPEVCFQTNVIFPHVTDAFLERLGIQEHYTTMSLPREEIQKVFLLLASQINQDSVDIQERLRNQKEQCELYHRNSFCLIDEISVLLKEHRCPTADFECVLALLEDLTDHFQKTLRSAGQMGMLTCENRMAVCWRLVTDYISVLREQKAVQIQSREKQTETEDLVPATQPSKTGKKSSRLTCCDTIKMALLWTILLILIFMGLLAVHYRCQVDSDHQICSFDFFIQRIQLGNPPY